MFLAAVGRTVNFEMAENHRRTLHLFALDNLTVITVLYEAVKVSIVCKRTVGCSGSCLFVDIIKRGKVPCVAKRIVVCGCFCKRKGMNAGHLVSFGQCR